MLSEDNADAQLHHAMKHTRNHLLFSNVNVKILKYNDSSSIHRLSFMEVLGLAPCFRSNRLNSGSRRPFRL